MRKDKKIRRVPMRRKSVILAIIFACIVILASSLIYLEKTKKTDFIKDPSYTTPATDEVDKKNQLDPTIPKKADPKTQGVDISKNTSEIPQSTTSTITIESLSQSGGLVSLRATINNAENTGSCTATFTSDGAKPVVRTITPKNSSCSIDIPEMEFSSIGTWRLTLRYFGNDAQSIATKDIVIK